MLVGNKIDLCSHNPNDRKVPKKEAELFAKKNNLLYEETSAISNEHIKEVFEIILESNYNSAIYNQRSKVVFSAKPNDSNINLGKEKEHTQEGICCYK